MHARHLLANLIQLQGDEIGYIFMICVNNRPVSCIPVNQTFLAPNTFLCVLILPVYEDREDISI